MPKTLILASESPRRRELLNQLDLPFMQTAAHIDETPFDGEKGDDYVARMAREKASAVQAKLMAESIYSSNTLVLGADTIIECDSQILGKPLDYDQFSAMMTMLSGRSHRVKTAVCVLSGEHFALEVVSTDVAFKSLTSKEILWYWQTEEPKDKAGGYAIQGKGAQFVAHINGSYSGVVGLPLYETSQLLKTMGMPICERRTTD